jgi:hypothetical protein
MKENERRGVDEKISDKLEQLKEISFVFLL